jgi:pilus assembly protein CpaC
MRELPDRRISAVLTVVLLCVTCGLGQNSSAPPQPTGQSPQPSLPQPTQQTQTPTPAQAPAPGAAPSPPQAFPGETAPETQSLHILVGRSVVINLQARLRRVLVSNPGVLETITTSPTQLVVTAKAAGTSSLVLWDETGHSRILDVYSDVDVAGLREALQLAFPSENIQISGEQGRVILSGGVSGKAVADDIVKLASSFTKDVVNTLVLPPVPLHGKQILLKVRFAEVDRTKLDAFGLNIISTGALNTPGAISTGQFGPPGFSGTVQGGIPPAAGSRPATAAFTVTDILNIFVFRPDLNLAATIKDLQNKSILQILAEPNLMAMSGQPARFLAGGEFPFPVVQGGTTSGTAVTIQFRPFGVRLEFTGTIGPDNVVRLKVAPEVSTLDFTNALSLSGFTVPAISTRRAETEIELKDGQSFGIAGLLDQRATTQLSKIPGIGDIPILGQLFRSRSVSRSNGELLVLVTPTIVDPLSAPMQEPKGPSFPEKFLGNEKFDSNLPDKNKSDDASKPKP